MASRVTSMFMAAAPTASLFTPPCPTQSSTPNIHRRGHVAPRLSAVMAQHHTINSCPYSPSQFSQCTATLQQAIHELDQARANIAHTIILSSNNPEQIAKTANQVIVALATLQSSVQDLSRAYINHANTVLAPGRGGELNSNLTNILSESGLLNAQGGLSSVGISEEVIAGAEGKKKRKRVPHDPNAPKRALTPYFLYMQSARQQIAKELGENAKPKEVADEGTRRWGDMPPAEKAVSLMSLVSFLPLTCPRSGMDCTKRTSLSIASAWLHTRLDKRYQTRKLLLIWSKLARPRLLLLTKRSRLKCLKSRPQSRSRSLHHPSLSDARVRRRPAQLRKLPKLRARRRRARRLRRKHRQHQSQRRPPRLPTRRREARRLECDVFIMYDEVELVFGLYL